MSEREKSLPKKIKMKKKLLDELSPILLVQILAVLESDLYIKIKKSLHFT